jgi:hypothetical protein
MVSNETLTQFLEENVVWYGEAAKYLVVRVAVTFFFTIKHNTAL